MPIHYGRDTKSVGFYCCNMWVGLSSNILTYLSGATTPRKNKVCPSLCLSACPYVCIGNQQGRCCTKVETDNTVYKASLYESGDISLGVLSVMTIAI